MSIMSQVPRKMLPPSQVSRRIWWTKKMIEKYIWMQYSIIKSNIIVKYWQEWILWLFHLKNKSLAVSPSFGLFCSPIYSTKKVLHIKDSPSPLPQNSLSTQNLPNSFPSFSAGHEMWNFSIFLFDRFPLRNSLQIAFAVDDKFFHSGSSFSILLCSSCPWRFLAVGAVDQYGRISSSSPSKLRPS